MEARLTILGVIVAWTSVAVSAFNWTASSPADGTSIPLCPGDNVTIPWSFETSRGDALVNVEWYFQPEGDRPRLLATYVAGNYLTPSTTTQELSFLPNAGLQVSRVQQDQFGVYTVHVNINKGGSSDTETRNVTLLRPEPPIASGGRLTASVQPRAVYREDTREWHVQLECGKLLDIGNPPFTVLWTTSQEETVNSSSYSNGTFYLTLPNPAEGGDYTCSLSSTDHTTACLNLNPSLANGAAVKVDSVLTKFMVLEGRLEALQEENRELNQTDRTLHQQVNMLQAQNANLTSQLQQLRNSCSVAGSHTSDPNSVVRLVDGRWPSEGRLEVKVDGAWGTVCDDDFTVQAATVVCRMLQIHSTSPVLLKMGTNFPPGTGLILLDDVRCEGNEASIFSCNHSPVGHNNCDHREDVGLSC
ncbi:protein bark beetle-like [Pomacea canaliculata]|uniref:protein bark beetle-like n=1 Tax=Pomacea canaliculata TaxID=400727 RepID=UPI000D73FF7A|nr:protein bark beetle-like [Pomacea canaliculata]